MKNKKLTNDQICEACLKEMFKRVGTEYPNEELTKQDKWYTKYTWTRAQEDEFRKWMKEFLKKHSRWTAKHADFEIGMFLLNWGWKVSDDKVI